MLDFSRKPIIGYVQLDKLKKEDFDYDLSKGILDAINLERGGIDAIVVENYSEPEKMARADSKSKECMKLICPYIRKNIRCAVLGINVLPADIAAAFGFASTYGFEFVHADIYVDKVISKETGRHISVNLEYALRLRRRYPTIPLIASIDPWHTYKVLDKSSIGASARRAVHHGANALAVLGKDGNPPDINHIRSVKQSAGCPVGAGSSINPNTIKDYIDEVDFFLVSGYLKYNGIKTNPVDSERVAKLMEEKNRLLRRQ